jgi:two-component system response regulator GlrR
MKAEALKILLLNLDLRDRVRFSDQDLLAAPEFSLAFVEPAPEAADIPAWISATIAATNPDLVLMAFGSMSYQDCQPALRRVREADARLPLLALAREWDSSQLMDFLRQGFTDFVTMPFRAWDVFPRIARLAGLLRNPDPVAGLKEKLGMRKLLGGSRTFLSEVEKIPMLARCDAGVLITGETGTGKEMCARAIHYLGSRSGKPFVAVNCGAIPADLVENELFGHEREAFTGAMSAKAGLLREAQGGTLFLDEVDSLPALAQVKLLRFLQEKEYRPLGSAKPFKADIRIIAASNQDLARSVAEGRMRKDLYYRLNVVALELPPLRDRKDDISLLLDHFLEKYCGEYRVGPFEVSPEALRALAAYAWPGNIRQLEHSVQRAVLLARGPVLWASDFPLASSPAAASPGETPQSFHVAKARLVRDFERQYIESLLAKHKGNISHAAKTAQKNRRAFFELMQKHAIEVGRFRSGEDPGSLPA